MKRTLKTVVWSTLFLAQASLASACPMCKYALESSDTEPRAYMISILFMMGTISTLFLSMAGLLWWVTSQEKKNLTAAGYQHLFENGGSQPHLVSASSHQ